MPFTDTTSTNCPGAACTSSEQHDPGLGSAPHTSPMTKSSSLLSIWFLDSFLSQLVAVSKGRGSMSDSNTTAEKITCKGTCYRKSHTPNALLQPAAHEESKSESAAAPTPRQNYSSHSNSPSSTNKLSSPWQEASETHYHPSSIFQNSVDELKPGCCSLETGQIMLGSCQVEDYVDKVSMELLCRLSQQNEENLNPLEKCPTRNNPPTPVLTHATTHFLQIPHGFHTGSPALIEVT